MADYWMAYKFSKLIHSFSLHCWQLLLLDHSPVHLTVMRVVAFLLTPCTLDIGLSSWSWPFAFLDVSHLYLSLTSSKADFRVWISYFTILVSAKVGLTLLDWGLVLSFFKKSTSLSSNSSNLTSFFFFFFHVHRPKSRANFSYLLALSIATTRG